MKKKTSHLNPLPSTLKILVTNDDGLDAPGIQLLEKIARKLSKDVWVVAPEQEQSGAGHSLTLHVPVRVRKLAEKKYAVSGTPTDCVMLASHVIAKGKKFDLILSGINRGSNVGDDITYSGTCAAAMEGTLLGIPSIALSQLFIDEKPIHWATAEKFAPDLIRKVLKAGWPKNVFINMNFPNCAPQKVKGICCPAQGKRVMSVALHARIDPKKRPYYWIGGERDNKANSPHVDVAKLDANYVTVTPISMDMTDYKALQKLESALGL